MQMVSGAPQKLADQAFVSLFTRLLPETGRVGKSDETDFDLLELFEDGAIAFGQSDHPRDAAGETIRAKLRMLREDVETHNVTRSADTIKANLTLAQQRGNLHEPQLVGLVKFMVNTLRTGGDLSDVEAYIETNLGPEEDA